MQPPTATDRTSLLRRASWIGKLLILLASAYLTWRIVAEVGSSSIASRLAAANRAALVIAFLLLAARFVAWDLRWRTALRRIAAPMREGRTFLALTASALINLVTPTARLLGGFMRARYMARSENGSYGFWLGSVLFDQVAHQVVMVASGVVALGVTAVVVGRPEVAVGIFSVLAGVTALLWRWGRRRGSAGVDAVARFCAGRAARADGRMQRFFSHGQEAAEVFRRLAADAALRREVVLLGLLFVVLNVFAQWTVFLALGTSPDLWIVAVAVLVGTGAGMLFGTPGGVGATEAAMIACYAIFGVAQLPATAATLLYRGLHYAVVLATGLPAFVYLELRTAPRSRELEGLEGIEMEVES